MDYRIFNASTDDNACDNTRGCTDTVRESALKVDSGRKIPCRAGESNLRQQRASPMLLPTELRPACVCVFTCACVVCVRACVGVCFCISWTFLNH